MQLIFFKGKEWKRNHHTWQMTAGSWSSCSLIGHVVPLLTLTILQDINIWLEISVTWVQQKTNNSWSFLIRHWKQSYYTTTKMTKHSHGLFHGVVSLVSPSNKSNFGYMYVPGVLVFDIKWSEIWIQNYFFQIAISFIGISL